MKKIKMDKETALTDFLEKMRDDEFYPLLTDDERERLNNTFKCYSAKNTIVGTFDHRWRVMNLAYTMFLEGLGGMAELHQREIELDEDYDEDWEEN